MQRLKQEYRLLTRKCFDWSFLPVIGWNLAFAFYIWYVFARYVVRFKGASPLLRAHYMLLRAGRYNANTSILQRVIEAAIKQQFSRANTANFNPPPAVTISDQALADFKRWGGLVLKAPRFAGHRVVEKGVLALRFNRGFCVFRNCVDVTAVLQSYVLVLEPGWSGYANEDILYFTHFPDFPVIVMATEKRDYEFLKNLDSNLIPVSFGASDWVNPSVFYPLGTEKKKYDAVMVAKWKIFKRHHILLRALHETQCASLKVALVGIQLPQHRNEVEFLINSYGVGDKVTVFGLLPQPEVNRVLNQSRVNLILSLQEGSNKALFEGFFAGTPGLALQNNIGIQKDYFTPQTGRLIKETELGAALLYFREHWTDFDPRSWAEANIAPEITTAKLNQLLKTLSRMRNEEWRRNLAVKCNTPWSKYYPDEQAGFGLPLFEEILVQYARST